MAVEEVSAMHVQQDEPTHQPLIAHTPGWNAAVTVGILGWVLDAFDFFVIFLLTELAAKRANQQRPTVTKIPRTLWSHAGIFGYLLLVMTATNCLSHGTQDLYLLVWPGTARETPRLDQIPIPRRRHPERSEGSLYSPNAATAYKIAKPSSRTQTQRPSRWRRPLTSPHKLVTPYRKRWR